MTKIKYLQEFADDGSYYYFITDERRVKTRILNSRNVSMYEDISVDVMDWLLSGYTIVPVANELKSVREISLTEYIVREKQQVELHYASDKARHALEDVRKRNNDTHSAAEVASPSTECP